MQVSRRNFLRLAGMAALGAGMSSAIKWSGLRVAQAAEANPALHILNRITWGPRPEDIAHIEQMGIEAYIDWQLQPESIPDPAVIDFYNAYPQLSLPTEDLYKIETEDYDSIWSPLIWSRIFRAAYSQRQLYELMVEFWTDHFNIPVGDYLSDKVVDDREVIRKHALGKFRDLLFASAQSPAMLYYLDNAFSNQEHPNENYAREVMELHTLGVEGGYTEQDVKEVARALTGWTVRDGWPGRFYFDQYLHDYEEKTILGRVFPAGRGVEEGLQFLDMLATHPATAYFISHKLARRFVSDTPPTMLVESAAQVFIATDGDIRQVMRHILTSSELMAAPGQKFRRPLDFMVAMIRVMLPALTVDDPSTLIWPLDPMGQLPFYWNPPNGYPDAAGAWMNTNGLLQRWNFAMLMPYASQEWFEGLSLDMNALVPPVATVGELVDSVTNLALNSPIAETDRDQLIAFVSDSGDPNQPVTDDLRYDKLPALLGLVLASPYFQWH